jgi:hypothetical protein
MCNPPLDNGEWMMRAQREAMQHARNEYFSELFGEALRRSEALRRAQQTGERPAEDVTGLRLLEEFLAKRSFDKKAQDKGECDGDERK